MSKTQFESILTRANGQVVLFPQGVTSLSEAFLHRAHVGAAACLHTSTFLRPFPSHSAELGRGSTVNLYSTATLLFSSLHAKQV